MSMLEMFTWDFIQLKNILYIAVWAAKLRVRLIRKLGLPVHNYGTPVYISFW